MKKSKKGNILLANSVLGVDSVIREALQSNFEINQVSTLPDCQFELNQKQHDFAFININVFADVLEQELNQIKTHINQLRYNFPSTPIIVLAPTHQTRLAVKTVLAGADEYLNYPIDTLEIHHVMKSIQEKVRMEKELDYFRLSSQKALKLNLFHTRSPKMGEVFKRLKTVATTKTTVLLLGESGTGKGVLSNLIHNNSNRSKAPFISVHCGAIPENLVESELFGHEKGSFTGAYKQKLGKFELAKGGTLFLDEIGTIPKTVQIKLLKILQEKIFYRVGGDQELETDVRIIAATNENLMDLVQKNEFRADLFYRLNVFPIEIPSLRDRIEDIPILVEDFIIKMNDREQKNIKEIDPYVLEAFRKYPWPGNIRELENLIERAYILETTDVLTPESFPLEFFQAEIPKGSSLLISTQLPLSTTRKNALEAVERTYLKTLLTQFKGKISASAKVAGITTRQLHKLLTKYEIHKEDYKH